MSACPSCGFDAPDGDGKPHAYLATAPGCWAVFKRALDLHQADPRFHLAHNMLTDAYCLQHATSDDPRARRAAVVHLATLVFQFDHPGCEDVVPDLRIQLGRHGHAETFDPWPAPTCTIGTLSMHADDPEGHTASARAYCHQVFADWGVHHETARRILAEVLP